MAPLNYTIDVDSIAVPMGQVFDYIPLRKHSMQSREDSLTDQAYECILRKIVFPENAASETIKYGGKITESMIADTTGMSNGPIRKAMYHLRQEGWIETVPYKGSFFVDFSNPDIAREIYMMRLSIETGAFYSLASAATAEQITILRELVDIMESAKKQSDVSSFRKADIDFHLNVVEFANGKTFRQFFRPKLLQWYAVSFQVLMKSMGAEKYRHWLESPGMSSHRELYNAIASHDSVQAAKLINEHYGYVAHLLGIDK